MKIITGFLRQDNGDAVVCGINVKDKPLETKSKIGYLPEANPLYYEMYVREYLDFIADIHQVKNKKQRIEEVITMVGLTVESRKKVGQLSKGYKQRVGLAAALIHDPEVLILDEPTTGLDPNQIIEIREVIRKLGLNKTVLFSSHILQEVEAVCDRVVIINKGKLVANDTIAALRGSMEQSKHIRVSFQEKVSLEQLKKLSAVTRISPIDDHNWELQTGSPETLRKQLMELSLQENLNIVSLQSGEQSLEELFRELTR
jgi:ABC-2 type transport system ATP-binding protein